MLVWTGRRSDLSPVVSITTNSSNRRDFFVRFLTALDEILHSLQSLSTFSEYCSLKSDFRIPARWSRSDEKIGRRCLTDIVKRQMSCSVLQYSDRNKRSLRRNAAWLDLLRTAPSRGRTAQCSRLTQGETLVVSSMKPVQTAKLCFSGPWKWSREESSVILRYDRMFGRWSSVSLNHVNDQRAKFCCSGTL